MNFLVLSYVNNLDMYLQMLETLENDWPSVVFTPHGYYVNTPA
jgi:hypothetical protein